MTKAVFDALYVRIDKIHEDLGHTAGCDPLQDRYKCGAIAGYQDLLQIEFDEVSNDN